MGHNFLGTVFEWRGRLSAVELRHFNVKLFAYYTTGVLFCQGKTWIAPELSPAAANTTFGGPYKLYQVLDLL